MFSCGFNVMRVLLEEVALEGLDGITLQALELRLRTRHNEKVPVDPNLMKMYFDLLINHKDIEVYELPEKRGDLIISNFRDYLDPVTHIYCEPDKSLVPPDIYPYSPINDTDNCIQGSCSTYYTRQLMSKQQIQDISYEEITTDKYKNKIVLVANQYVRLEFLLLSKNNSVVNNVELSLPAYCILERIGRYRQYGCFDVIKELTNITAKDSFYHRKDLLIYNLITKQSVTRQCKTTINRINLLSLARYHVEHLSKVVYFMTVILQKLKNSSKTNYILPIENFHELFGFISTLSVKKLVNYFRLDSKVKEILLPYRQIYPDSKEKNGDKLISCLQLLDKNIDIKKTLTEDLEKKENESDDDEDEDDDEKDNMDVEINEVEDSDEQKNKDTQNHIDKLIDVWTITDYFSELNTDEDFISTQIQGESVSIHKQNNFLEQNTSSSSESEDLNENVTKNISIPCLKKKKGYLIDHNNPRDISIIKNLFQALEKAGPKGCAAPHINNHLKLQKSDFRTMLKHFPPVVDTYKKDEGRQRRHYLRLNKYKHIPIETYKNKTSDSICNVPKKRMKLSKSMDCTDKSSQDIASSTYQFNSEIVKDEINDEIISEDTNNLDEIVNVCSLESTQSLNDTNLDFINATVTEVKHNPTGKEFTKMFVVAHMLYRSQNILNYINTHGLTLGILDVQKYVIEKDLDNNYSGKIDRKTLFKILGKLIDNGYIKAFDVTLEPQKHKTFAIKKFRIYAKLVMETKDPKFLKLIREEKLKFVHDKKLYFNVFTQVFNPATTAKRKKSQDDCDVNPSSLNDNKKESVDKKGSIKLNSIEMSLKQVKRESALKKVQLEELFNTDLMLKRAYDVLNQLNRKRIVTGFKELINHVIKEDEERKYLSKIDRKTLGRMMEKLLTHNYVKRFDLCLQTGELSKEVHIFTSLDVEPDEREMQFLMEREKMAYWSEVNPFTMEDFIKERSEPHEEFVNYPKFRKMEMLHKLIFHVVYSDVEPLPDQKQAKQNLERKFNVEIPNDHPPIYNDSELSILTFLPSLTALSEYPRGFILFQELHPLIPIRCFIQCLRMTMFLKEFEDYYFHPVKQFYPIKDTSATIFKTLTRHVPGRKNVATLYDVLANLACIGLLQMSKKMGLEKDNFLFYVNKKALLVDTRMSDPGYTEIETGKEYPSFTYTFESLDEVVKYWIDAAKICLETPLNIRSIAVGQTVITYKRSRDKPEMKEAHQHIDDIKTILDRDKGYIPGDKIGAAGFDSSLYGHLRRNWSVIVKNNSENETPKLDAPKVVKLTRKLVKPCRLIKTKKKTVTPKKVPVTKRVIEQRKNQKSSDRNVNTFASSTLRRLRQSIRWTEHDKDVLHISAFIYKLFNVKPYNILTRDVLVELTAHKDISTKILFSHYRKVLKLPENLRRRVLLECDIMHIDAVRQALITHLTEYRQILKRNKSKAYLYFTNTFRDIVSKIFKLVVIQDGQANRRYFPSSYDDFKENYYIASSQCQFEHYLPVPDSKANIEIIVLLNLIHSSLACSTDSEQDEKALSVCSFHAYQKYPEQRVHSAVRVLKRNHLIASKKSMNQNNQISLAPKYKLSAKYFFRLNLIEIPFNSYHGGYVEYNKLIHTNQSIVSLPQVNNGCLHLLLALLNKKFIDLNINTPKTLLLLDPKIGRVDSSYQNILDKYNKLVDFYKIGTKDENLNFDFSVDCDYDEEDIEKSMERVPPMNSFNAARLALYTLKDVLVKEKINSQHSQRLLTLNSCKIEIIKTNETKMKEYYSQFQSESFLKKIKNLIEIPALTQDEIFNLIKSDFENEIANFIENKFELGADIEDIRKHFGIKINVRNTLDLLIDKHVIIETGCISARYVHNKHVAPWLLKTYSNNDSNQVKEILMFPWIRVDGSINKSVLDYLLGVIISFILFNSCSTVYHIQEHFISVLQPFHVQKLIEYLVKLDCVTLYVIHEIKPSLFTKGSINFSPATGLEPPTVIHIEVKHSACLILGMFIGEKKYKKHYLEDFIDMSNSSGKNKNDLHGKVGS